MIERQRNLSVAPTVAVFVKNPKRRVPRCAWGFLFQASPKVSDISQPHNFHGLANF
jgi:hypothetical protein